MRDPVKRDPFPLRVEQSQPEGVHGFFRADIRRPTGERGTIEIHAGTAGSEHERAIGDFEAKAPLDRSARVPPKSECEARPRGGAGGGRMHGGFQG